MRTPFLYRVTRSIIRFVVRAYFRDVAVSGARNLPDEGPAILAANHPQSITDALILGLASDRMLCYLAHSGLFRNPLKRWFLHSCGVIPVYRRSDEPDSSEKNVETFSASYDTLEAGGVICIFPEGTSGQERRVQKLKTGAARIALQCEERRGWDVGVVMVPVGISFESRGRFHSRVLVSFGERIHVSDLRPEYDDDPVEAVGLLTAKVEVGIRSHVVDIGHAEYERLVRDIERIYTQEVVDRGETESGGAGRFKQGHAIAREIPVALEYFLQRKPEVIAEIRAALESYSRRLEQLNLKEAAVSKESTTIRGAAMRFMVWGLLGLPVAIYGTLWNALPYKLTGLVAKRLAPDLTKLHFYQITVGALFYTVFYVPLLYFLYRVTGAVVAGALAISFIPTGFFARWYTRLMRRRRDMLRLAWVQLTRGYAVQQLRQRRARLLGHLDTALDEYLIVRAGGVVGGREAPEE